MSFGPSAQQETCSHALFAAVLALIFWFEKRTRSSRWNDSA